MKRGIRVPAVPPPDDKSSTREVLAVADGMLYDTGSPSIEVRVYRHDALFARELCESESEAAAVVERWSEEGEFTFLVDDLTFHHAPDDVLAPEAPDLADDDYPIAGSELPARGVE